MKKALCLLLISIFAMTAIACRAAEPAAQGMPEKEAAAQPAATEEPVEPYKICLITCGEAENAEAALAAGRLAQEYGDSVLAEVYPANYRADPEAIAVRAAELAADPAVRALVFVPAVEGVAAAIERVRKKRPDMLVLCAAPEEDPPVLASTSDICLSVDEAAMGSAIPSLAARMGARALIHYSFARHMASTGNTARRLAMMAACEELGIEFLDVTIPDPAASAGEAATQAYIAEDVPRQVQEYGQNTAFFTTCGAAEETLIRAVVEQGAIYPQQCRPSPANAYPAALDIDVSGREDDAAYVLESVAAALKNLGTGQEKRMSTWTMAQNSAMAEAGVLYAIEFCEGRTNAAFDEAALSGVLQKVFSGCELSRYADEANGEIPGFILIMSEYYDFAAGIPYELD